MTTCINIQDSWIWLNPTVFPNHQRIRISQFDCGTYSGGMALFRRDFNLADINSGAIARVSGDCKYRLKVNGAIIGDGPPEIGGDYDNTQAPDWWFYDTFDFSGFLRPGKNIIEAEVMLDGECQLDYSTGHGGFLFELCDNNGEILLKSDSSWLCCLNPAWKPGMYDARLEPDDSEWTHAVELVDVRWNLKNLNLPPLKIVKIASDMDVNLPLTISPGAPQVVHLVFQQELAAIFAMSLSGSAGASVVIEYGEHPGIYHHRENYWLKNGIQHFRSTRMNAFKYIKLIISCGSFSSSSYESVTLLELSAFSRCFPVSLYASKTSDHFLNTTRKCCSDTLKLCMQRLHLDSPLHQEGLGCTGDYMIESLMSYYLFGEYRLAAADIKRTAYLLKQKRGVMFHTSYSLMWIEMVRDYLYYSGDLKLVQEVFPEIRLLLDLFTSYVGHTGLVSEAPNYMFVDWVNDGKYNYHHPPASRGMGAMTAWFYKALISGAELAEYCGESSEKWLKQASILKAAFQCELWNSKLGFYQDGVPGLSKRQTEGVHLPKDDGKVSFTMHTNILALAMGLVPSEKNNSLLARVMKHDWPMLPQPYFMHFVFEALYINGAFDQYAGELLSKWFPLVAEHPSGLKECWNCGDYCHAWGGTPAYQMGRSILGIVPLEPGFKTVLIAPHPVGLESASGEIPTPYGTIKLNWHLTKEKFKLNVHLPAKMKYNLRLPDSLGPVETQVEIY
jgi:alpha-L-rhamnosidase